MIAQSFLVALAIAIRPIVMCAKLAIDVAIVAAECCIDRVEVIQYSIYIASL